MEWDSVKHGRYVSRIKMNWWFIVLGSCVLLKVELMPSRKTAHWRWLEEKERGYSSAEYHRESTISFGVAVASRLIFSLFHTAVRLHAYICKIISNNKNGLLRWNP